MIRFENLTLGYGTRTLIDSLSGHIPSGGLTALVGRNGTGKSTLLRAIAALGPKQRGEIILCGKRIEELSPTEMAKTHTDARLGNDGRRCTIAVRHRLEDADAAR